MKKILIMSFALAMVILATLSFSAFAENTVSITGVSAGKYYEMVDNSSVLNDDYAKITVNYTVNEDTSGAVSRLTFVLAAQELTDTLQGNEAKVIYIDETVKPTETSFSFVIEKDRIRTALLASGSPAETTKKSDIANYQKSFNLHFKLGGANVSTAATTTVTYKNPTVFGDVDGDGRANLIDARTIMQGVARLIVLSDEERYTGDIDGDGNANLYDAREIMRIIAQLNTYDSVLKARFDSSVQ